MSDFISQSLSCVLFMFVNLYIVYYSLFIKSFFGLNIYYIATKYDRDLKPGKCVILLHVSICCNPT